MNNERHRTFQWIYVISSVVLALIAIFAILFAMDDIHAFSEMAPLLDNYDRELQRITDLYNQVRERDKGLLGRVYRRSRLMNWESMSEILDITRALGRVMRLEASVVQSMAQLPEPERMQFWHERFLPLEARKSNCVPSC